RIAPALVKDSPTGVFTGVMYHDYAARLQQVPESVEGQVVLGSAASVASGRVAYTFGLEGPAVTVDTACSSSLVAVHLACQALRQGECTLALAGGVTVMSTPDVFVEFSRQRALSPDGRCKAFSAAADGTGWAEGAGVVVLERLSDARRNGHPVLAVIRGSAVNQDGASNGLTAPNGPSQERVIRRALASAGLSVSEVDAVEAHGTGTELGDPIEAQAVLATYGRSRPRDRPLWLGSLKSNIGHAQAAAGVGGVIKMVQAMRHGLLPKTLHVDAPSPHVDWDEGGVALLTEAREWPRTGHPRRAGVSSFGVSGTNAHLVIEQAPQAETETVESSADGDTPADAAVSPVLPWVVSGRSKEALREQAARLRAAVTADPGLCPADVGFSLATTRATFEHRAVVVGRERDEFLRGLETATRGAEAPGLVQGAADTAGKVAFVFAGQGAQWEGMGADLLASSPVFAERLEECERALAAHVDWSLLEVLRGEAGAASLERVDVVQPALWAVMVALAEVWRSYGVEPAAVVGHSQGEIAAACVAGALSLEDGAKVVALRSQVIASALAGRGGMVSLALSVDRVEALVGRWPGRISVAAVNGPASVVVAGDPEALDELCHACQADGTRVRRLPVDYASHSAHVGAIEDRLLEALSGLTPRSAEVPFFSTVSGDWLNTAELGAGYWYRNLRQPVQFEPAVRALVEQGHGFFVETSPHPVLTIGIEETVNDLNAEAVAAGTLHRDEGDTEQFLHALAQAHVRGLPVDWGQAFAGHEAHAVDLPTYAFQHQRYWLEATGGPSAGAAAEMESSFWDAVEQGDVAAVADSLDVSDDERSSLEAVLPALSSWRRRSRERSTVDGWRYRINWKPVADVAAAILSGTWLVVAPAARAGGEWAAAVGDALHRHGARTVQIELDTALSDRESVAQRIHEGMADGSPVSGVLSLLGLDERPHPDYPALSRGVVATLALVQALGDTAVDAPLWIATCGAVSTGRFDRLTSPVQAQVWGLGRGVALEHPERWGGLVDLPGEASAGMMSRFAGVLSGENGEDQVAVRSSGVFVQRLVRAPGRDTPREDWRPSGTVMITGGTGALGAHVARWLACNGAEHLVLTSRRGPESPGAAELEAELTALGVGVTVAACDVADRGALAALLAEHPPTAIVHTAGVLDDGVLSGMTLEQMETVFRPKVCAALNLHELTRDLDLSAFVLFSSVAGVLGGAGQSNYAAANAFVDALAEHRRADGLVATSVAWGGWGGGGLAVDGGVIEEHLRQIGVAAMAPELAIVALRQALDRADTYVAVADIDWERYVLANASARPSRLIADVPEAERALGTAALDEDAEEDTSALARRIRGLAESERGRAVLDLVRTHAAAALGHEGPETVAADRAFRELGLDSLGAVKLRNRLGAATGLRLPPTIAYDYPSSMELAGYLQAEVLGTSTESSVPERITVAEKNDPVVIVAMGCRYPGGVCSPEGLWGLVAEGRDVVSGFPADRGWDVEGVFDPDPDRFGTSYTRHGGFLHDAVDFDADFFGISPREALAMDPQQRLLLEVAWEAFE
uniref:type I polyketide synthase n=1 Tax=Allosalinactinospora lopnorensis TaxID=1352348 RepID=UPI000623D591